MRADTPAPVKIDHLSLNIDTPQGTVHAVRDMHLELRPREILALVGESGSGKTLTARSVLGLLPPRTLATGTVTLAGHSVLEADANSLRAWRGSKAAMIFQEPATALNPVFRIGWQIEEGLRAHGVSDRSERCQLAIDMLRAVGIPEPEVRIDHYPHQFSGGQKQRIIIAMALALRPSVIIADEPTTALDVTVQAEILELLRECRDRFGASILLITHNMGVVADLADRVAVMYRGRLVEQAPVDELFRAPREEYTKQLLAAVPRLGSGRAAKASVSPRGEDRIASSELALSEPASQAQLASTTQSPAQSAPNPKTLPDVQVTGLDIVYRGGFGKETVHAVRSVSFDIAQGEVVGLVGESGSGKSTIARAIGGLEPIAGGQLRVFGEDLTKLRGRPLRALRRRIGFVFQDPASSFNSFMTIADCIMEPMATHRLAGGRRVHYRRALELLDAVELPSSVAQRYPFELSGGQRQRVGLARALALSPALVIADEPTSALDVSVQARVLELFSSLQRELGFSSLFISHDLAVVEMLASRVGVLRRGELVEIGSTEGVLHSPQHSYTQRLIEAVPVPDPVAQREQRRIRNNRDPRTAVTEEPME